MGSINCKEYKTDSTIGKPCQPNSSTTESYHTKTCDEMDGNFEEHLVCSVDDIQENEMKQLQFGEDNKVLLIKQNGEITAMGNKCSHYGAPLHTGALGNGRVRCPWHGACFNTKTGDIEDFPGLDSLPCYNVNIESNGQIKVRARKSDLEKNKRIKDMVKRCESDERTYVIVGGGPSGAVCAETLRQEGYTGRIVMICKENCLPYDRIKISKSLDVLCAALQFRPAEFYEEYGIETMLDVEATSMNTTEKTITCSNGYSIKYDKIFLATGAKPFVPPIEGANLENVFTLRDAKDANNIYKTIKESASVVCLGSSFIALEVSAYFARKVKTTTVVARDDVPLKQSLGTQIGNRILKLYLDNNVHMVMNSGITHCIGDEAGKIKSVKLIDGSELPCDILILGTGTKFNTDFVKQSGVIVNERGSIDTDMHLMTNIPDVYVGGDIANAPIFSAANQRATIGHYQLAQYHGRIAGINMAGSKIEDLRAVPFFWAQFFGKGIRFSGYGTPAETRIEGSLEDLSFIAFNFDEHGNVISMASCGRDPIVSQFAELQSQGKRLHKQDIGEEDPTSWTKLLRNQERKIC